jgi:hypothetical protein
VLDSMRLRQVSAPLPVELKIPTRIISHTPCWVTPMLPGKSKQPRDVNQLVYTIVQESTRDEPEQGPGPE